jgi:hypothetical protein
MAINSGFRSGLARDRIFRNEDAVGGGCANVTGRTLDNIVDFAGRVEGVEDLRSLEGGRVARVLDGIRRER